MGTGHFQMQPFGQVRWLEGNDLTVFENGAAVLHIAEKVDVLLPSEPEGRRDAIKWLVAAFNSVEVVSLPWLLFQIVKDDQKD